MSRGKVPSLVDAFKELEDYAEDVANASQQNFFDSISRFFARLSSPPIGPLLNEILPAVDFEAWYKAANATQGGTEGSAQLDWPNEITERVALQRELIRRMAEGSIDIFTFVFTFNYVANDFGTNLSRWVSQVFRPFHRDLVRLANPAIRAEEAAQNPTGSAEISKPVPFHFIDKTRIAELTAISSASFDLTRLIELCREIEFCYRNECFLAVAALTRALLDHVPPIFSLTTFAEVANNYSGGKSFQESMQHLENSARKIGDAHLHNQIRKREILPTATQVNFANDLDVLLGEIVRKLS